MNATDNLSRKVGVPVSLFFMVFADIFVVWAMAEARYSPTSILIAAAATAVAVMLFCWCGIYPYARRDERRAEKQQAEFVKRLIEEARLRGGR